MRQDSILEGINRILREAISSDTEAQLGRVCLAVAEQITASKFGFIGELNRESGLLDLLVISDPGWAACRMQSPRGKHKAPSGFENRGLFGRVLSSEAGFYTNEPTTHTDGVGTPEGHPLLTAFLGVPLIQHEEVFGMVAVANREGGYHDDDLTALRALAEPIVQALMRRRAEVALQQSEASLKEAQRITHVGNWSLDLEANRLAWSDEIYRIFEIDPERFGASYEAFLDAIHPEDREAVNTAYTESVANSTPYEIDHRLLMKDGRIKRVQERCETYYDEDGRPLRSVGTVQDITERRRAERLLDREAERAGVLLDLYQMAQHLTDKELYDYALDQAVRLTDSEIGFFHRVSEDQESIILTTWNRAALERCSASSETHYPVTDAGNWVDCLRLGQPIIYNDFGRSPHQKGLPEGHSPLHRFMSIPVIEDGKVRVIFGVGNKQTDYDDTDVQHLELVANELHQIIRQLAADAEIRKLTAELEQRVRDRTAQLAAVNQELEAFAYSVSHDLRAPLRAIEGFSQALIEDYEPRLDAQGVDFLHRVSSESQRMAQLIDDLLKLSRITRAELRTEQVGLSELALETIERLRAAEPDRRVSVEVAAGISRRGDPGLLRQVLENLLSNAWKFSGRADHAEIEFGLDDQDGEEVLYVRDNGVGFDMKYANKLFAPFQRLHAMTEFPGSGIGLSTVQRIVARHGGRVWCDSEPGKGTTFFFTLGHPDQSGEDQS
jgi:PAS domain S-box-containing protein